MNGWEKRDQSNTKTVLIPGMAKPLGDDRKPQLLGVGKRVRTGPAGEGSGQTEDQRGNRCPK